MNAVFTWKKIKPPTGRRCSQRDIFSRCNPGSGRNTKSLDPPCALYVIPAGFRL
jgi:hypothetical protein